MKQLEASGLYGAGLIDINTPVLVSRYNGCLEQLGIAPTALKRFRVDGIGWSPEVAMEKENIFYLGHGVANQCAIILSPDQRRKPIYWASTTFERQLMIAYFDAFAHEIVDVTTSTGIALSIDQGLTDYQSPHDLALVNYVVVQSSAGGLFRSARTQRDLVHRFEHEPLGWFDRMLRESILKSAREYGDLRYRRADIPDFRFAGIDSYYTRAFGGVFVFQPQDGYEGFLVFEDEDLYRVLSRDHDDVFYLRDKRLIEHLVTVGLVEINLTWYRDNPDQLAHLEECIAAQVITAAEPERDFISMTDGQRKRALIEYRDLLPEVYFDLERLERSLERRQEKFSVPPSLVSLLLRPTEGHNYSLQTALEVLLCRVEREPIDVLAHYTMDKNGFFEAYKTWSAAKRAWVIDLLSRLYKPRMNMT